MANGRRSTYRRKGRRGHRSLSTRRIFNNKSAKAQASQIYALRKSISRVRRQCKPEVKVQYTQQTDGRVFTYQSGFRLTDARFNMPNISEGTGDGSRIGNMIKLYPLKVNTAMYYDEVINTHLGYPPFSELQTHGGQIRFIAIQAKSALNTAPELTDILRAVSFDGQSDSAMMMRMSFKTGITARFNILKNKVFTLSKDKPCLSTTIKVVPKSRALRYEYGFTYPKGYIWCFWLASGMVRRQAEEGEETVEDYNKFTVAWRMEQAYTDA